MGMAIGFATVSERRGHLAHDVPVEQVTVTAGADNPLDTSTTA
jgi:hypothetical protein